MAEVEYSGPVEKQTAAQALGGNRVVIVVDGEADYADSGNVAHAAIVRGITTGAIASGAEGDVQVFGPMIEPSWSWTPNQPLYVGTNGALTHTAPTTGFILEIAMADSATRIFIHPRLPILLA